jgi:hypothetical protein
MITSRSFLLRMKNVSDKRLGKIETQLLCSETYSRKSCRLRDNVGKYGRARQATDNNREACALHAG